MRFDLPRSLKGYPSHTVAIKIDGRATAKTIRSELIVHVSSLKSSHQVTPGLAVVLVGSRTDSAVYVRMKKKAAEEVGFNNYDIKLPEDVAEATLIQEVKKLNEDPKVHGILVQLPLPKQIDEARVLKTIKIEKDVDGFSALNIGNLCLRGGDAPLASPCTPADAVVVGRSNIVGMPVAAMLQAMNATVTVCHSRTVDLSDKIRRADIVVAAIGKPEIIRGSWLKKGAVVLDVGINEKEDKTKKRGYRLVGDVCYDEAKMVCSAITPVPGGIGPMTIAMLLVNTINLARHSVGLLPIPSGGNSC
eukprot:GSMAST32.ASY1.ANO1.2332.1 assembled CDS